MKPELPVRNALVFLPHTIGKTPEGPVRKMENMELIQGDAVLRLFKELQQKKTPLRVKLANGDCEHLSHLKQIRKRLRTHYFLIDYNEDFQAAARELEELHLNIEFTGEDGIPYAFHTKDRDVSRDVIWLKFPESIHRYQRRSLFRLEAPHGTRLFFEVDKIRYKLLVINMSLGGTFGVLVSVTKAMEQELKLEDPQTLENVELVFPSRNNNKDDSRVAIKQCQINRQERNPQTKKYECAIEFKEVAETEQKKLNELFYNWQRDYLRKRSLFKS
jgi:c-di-GMP-binding flagellar brake protein YcgR